MSQENFNDNNDEEEEEEENINEIAVRNYWLEKEKSFL